MEKETIEVKVELLQAVVNYLGTRPFREVVGMMQALGSLKPEKPGRKPGVEETKAKNT